jgi:hypothetical protein
MATSVREHLKKTHETMAAHHEEMAKCHGAAMGKAAAGDVHAEFHKVAQSHHQTAAQFHRDAMAACAKAAESDLLKLTPTGISGVAPARPSTTITAVPRTGAKPFPTNTAPEFVKVLGLDEESFHSEERSLG